MAAEQVDAGDSCGVPFAAKVPDFVQADWYIAMPKSQPLDKTGKPKHGRRPLAGLHWAVHLAVINQRSARVVIPDVLLGQVFWGGDKQKWPANWSKSIYRRLKAQRAFIDVQRLEATGPTGCPEICSMHGLGIRHRHYSLLIRTERDITDVDRLDEGGHLADDAWLSTVFLGVVELFGYNSADGERLYDFSLQTQQEEMEEERFDALSARISRSRRSGRLASVYLPLRVFAAPRLGLSFEQRQMLLAIARELTRDRRSQRPDKALVISADNPAKVLSTVDQYPGLPKGCRFVAFNGNAGKGKRKQLLRGRGYRLFGDHGWLVRSGYRTLWADEQENDKVEELWPRARKFLSDLLSVSGIFGLVVAGRHMKTGEWLGLAELLSQTDSLSGRNWVRQSALRIYTEDDFLVRWRRVIAVRMGFSEIPNPDQELAVPLSPTASSVQLKAHLSKLGISQTGLAAELGIKKSLVSQYLTGHKTWTPAWRKRLQQWIEKRAEGGPR